MKVSESLKIIDEGWVKKPNGFPVHFQKMVGSELMTDFVPGEDEALLDSDVVRGDWRGSFLKPRNPISRKSAMRIL